MEQNPRGVWVISITVVLGVIDTLAIILRFIARRRSKMGLGADDWLIAASLVPAHCMVVIAGFWVSKGGAGRRTATLTESETTLVLKLLIPASITYALTITLVKMSVLLLYRRIFATPNFKRATLILGILSVCWGIAAILGQILLCQPISAAWKPDALFTKKCGDIQAYFRAVTISNMLLDVIILCLPIHMVLKLHLPTRKRIVISGIFMLGGLSCIASIVRVVTVGSIKDDDIAYTMVSLYIWSHIEPGTALLSACFVTYRPLFANLHIRLPSILSRSKPGSANLRPWSDSKTSKVSNGSSSRAETGSGLEGGTLGDHDRSGYVNIKDGSLKEDLYELKLSSKRQDSEATTEYERTAIPAERDTSWVK